MLKIIGDLKEAAFAQVPIEIQPSFRLDCAVRNNFRFSFLPYLNILTQLACFAIYLYIYPAVFPEKSHLDPARFTLFSVVYIGVNIILARCFHNIKGREQDERFARSSNRLITLFLGSYILLESAGVFMEAKVSGNIYRFLATYFIVAFLPILPRMQKVLLLTLYALLVEAGFTVLLMRGFSKTYHYREMVIIFYMVCVGTAMVVYSNHVRAFSLKYELLEANRKLQELTNRDPLTNIANRRAFDEYIHQIWEECKRNGNAVNLLMLDIDWFKVYNDCYGHQQGDECLKLVAGFLEGYFTRSIDMVARYGGEEFMVLLPYTSVAGVVKMAEGVRDGIGELRIESKNAQPWGYITISVGVSRMEPEPGGTYEDLIKRADDALYRAKRSGRNTVCYSGDDLKLHRHVVQGNVVG